MTDTHQTSNSNSVSWKIFVIWFALIFIWGLFTAVFILTSLYKAGSMHDYNAYYQAAQRLNDGMPLYNEIEVTRAYLYPPLLAQLLAPLDRLLPANENAVIWIVFNIFCLLLTTFLLATQFKNKWKRYFIWILPFLFLPVIETFTNGQIVSIMSLLIVGAMVAYKHNHPMLVGICLAFATWLKIYPIVIIFYFILRRDWRVVIYAFVVGMALLFLQISLSNVDLVLSFFTHTLVNLASQGQDFNLFRNHSIFGFAHRIFAGNPAIASMTQWGIAGVMLVVMIVAGVRTRNQKVQDLSHEEFELEYGMVVAYMLLMGSTLLSTSMLPIIIPIAIALKYVRELRHYIIWAASFLGISFTFGFISNDLTQYNANAILQGYGFYSIVIMWMLLLYLHWQRVQAKPQQLDL
jgi:hypothetical protein